MEFTTQLGTLLEISPQDFADCRAAGNAWFDAELNAATKSTNYIKLSRSKPKATLLIARWKSWDSSFELLTDVRRREKTFADVLEWGKGIVLCEGCSDIIGAASLRCEEALIDGIYKRRFSCLKGHTLWITPENMLGVISGADYDFRPMRRQSPWLPSEI